MDIKKYNPMNLLEDYSWKIEILKNNKKTIYSIFLLLIIFSMFSLVRTLLSLKETKDYEKILSTSYNSKKLDELRNYEDEIMILEEKIKKMKKIELLISDSKINFEKEKLVLEKSMDSLSIINYLHIGKERISIEGEMASRMNIIDFINNYYKFSNRKIELQVINSEEDIYLYSLLFEFQGE